MEHGTEPRCQGIRQVRDRKPQPTLPLPLNGARHRWPSGTVAGALSGAQGIAGAEAVAVISLLLVQHGGHGCWHPQHPPQLFGAFSGVLLEAWWALS